MVNNDSNPEYTEYQSMMTRVDDTFEKVKTIFRKKP